MTTTSSAPVLPTAETPDNSISSLPIYREDTHAAPWTVGTRTVLGLVVGAVVGTVALSWFGLVLGTAVGLGIGLLLDNGRTAR
ncbi:hypothetical protein IF650_12250 [Cellulosimicrobium terreum]|nr:hypothetical protein [Cellulosimicrobium terreum]